MSNHPRHRPDFLSNQTEQHDPNILALDQVLYPARNHTLDRHYHTQISVVFQLHSCCHKCTFRGGYNSHPQEFPYSSGDSNLVTELIKFVAKSDLGQNPKSSRPTLAVPNIWTSVLQLFVTERKEGGHFLEAFVHLNLLVVT